LKTLYPWATFQFLAVKDWANFSSDKPEHFSDHWVAFVKQLEEVVYNKTSNPTFNRSGGISLETMKFTNSKQVRIGTGTCETTPNPRVHFKAVQDGLELLHELYDTHVTKMWEILNSLVIVIRDPQTNSDSIRIHPNVINPANGGSKQVVDQLANNACELLKNFYVAVESKYLESIAKLE
jgi:hypothetical protein